MVDRAGKALINVNVLAAYCFFCDGALTGGMMVLKKKTVRELRREWEAAFNRM